MGLREFETNWSAADDNEMSDLLPVVENRLVRKERSPVEAKGSPGSLARTPSLSRNDAP